MTRKITSLLFLSLLSLTSSAFAIKYHEYVNPRFCYRIEYPDFLTPQPESENGDGRQITGKTSKLIVYGSYEPENIDEIYQYAMDDLKGYKITYKNKSTDAFVLSGSNGTEIAYFKSMRKCANINFRLYYRSDEKKMWDEIVAHINSSFKFLCDPCKDR